MPQHMRSFPTAKAIHQTRLGRGALLFLGSALGLLWLPSVSFAQNVIAEPLYGSVSLEQGFLPDPHVTDIVPGGADSVEDLGSACVGYINAEQPDFDLNYQAASAQLGIFVSALEDTTLIINDPQGNWHCNDDSEHLSGTNPGVVFSEPSSGNYNIWVGTYDADSDFEEVKLVITEWDAEDWASLDLGSNPSSATVSNSNSDGSINFGDNSSNWSNDGECDDSRFTGDGMATTLVDEDIAHDANDCRQLFEAGSIRLNTSSFDANATVTGNNFDGIDFGDDASSWSGDGECDDPRFEGDGVASFMMDSDRYHDASDCQALYANGSIQLVAGNSQTSTITSNGGRLERGTLAPGDTVLSDDSFADTFEFNGNGGNTVIDLRSGDFDTYLIVTSPDGQQTSNDDYDGSTDRSLITIEGTQAGTWTAVVSSFQAGETGGYTLEINTEAALATGESQSHSGSLNSADTTFSDGEYFDEFTFQGRPGQRVDINLQSDDFDTYLVLNTPNGESSADDDGGDGSNSRITTDLDELGEYTIAVTSYGAEETGAYDLSIVFENASDSSQDDVIELNFGESNRYQLTSNDNTSDDGRYQDIYSFTANRGADIEIEMNSAAVDTHLSIITPTGQSIENDDYQGSTDRSLISLNLEESGRYRVIASTYASGETGDYRLSLNSGTALLRVDDSISSSSGGQIFGVFAGIADYPGSDSDLFYTDQDATRARDALIEGASMPAANAITLIDSEATLSNFRTAIRDLAARMDEDDTFVVFYSGHGSRVPRAGGPDSSDPDGLDETIELYDGSLIDDELAALFDEINVGTLLLVMDACFSGGFSKDIVSKPGRMGLFSSEEDVTSQVAVKFQAGGYLSVFFDEAVRGGYADRDEDGALTAIELSQYLHDRYRADVKSSGASDYVRTSGPQSNYQHLVVDRGGVGPYNVLFDQR